MTTFIVEKDPGLIPQILTKILDSCVNGVTLSDPDLEDMPLVYVNKAFETVTGYSQEETIGKNCRFLQGTDRDQEDLPRLREALRHTQFSPLSAPSHSSQRFCPCSCAV